MKWMILLFCFVGLSTIIQAGDRKGNGADVVKCSNRYELLDFYEQKLNFNINTKLNEVDLLLVLLEKVEPFFQGRIQSYHEQIKSFYLESRFVESSEIGGISDTGSIDIQIPSDCRLHQLILQKHIVFGNEKRYLIDQKIWNELSIVQKAGAIFHEIIYRDLKTETSKKLRKFNSYFFDSILNDKTIKAEFIQALIEAGYPWIYLYGIPVNSNYIEINQERINLIRSYPGLPFNIFSAEVTSIDHLIDQYRNGFPKFVFFQGNFSFSANQFKFDVCSDLKICKVTFFKNGKVSSLNNVKVIDQISQKEISNILLHFNEEGHVMMDSLKDILK